MAMSRRGGNRSEAPIWPGFVDAMTALLLVLMFVLSIFMIVQSVLRETIDTQDVELSQLAAQVSGLADQLGLERGRVADLTSEVGRLGADLTAAQAAGQEQTALIATLSDQLQARQDDLDAATGRIASFEAQVASLLAERDAARGQADALTASVAELEAAQTRMISEQEALNLALAKARTETDAQLEAARLAAARADALDGLIAEMKARVDTGQDTLAKALSQIQAAEADANKLRGDLETARETLSERDAALLAERAAAAALAERLAGAEVELSAEEKRRLADAAATEALRIKLANSDDALTAMTLALEEERKRAEETLTLLAAAQTKAAQDAGSADERAALLAIAQAALQTEREAGEKAARGVALLNEQISTLRNHIRRLQGLLDASAERDSEANIRLSTLGTQLNTALAQVASEQKRRADLEAAERARLEEEARKLAAETQNLEKFRSEFFGQMRQILDGREGIRVVGDRFVFSSEVLFTQGAADLGPEGREQIARVARTLEEVAAQIPSQLDWIIRVDGHTDNVPFAGSAAFADNWELSQARALSVVRYMQDSLGFPPNRLAATGFGEWQPIAQGDSNEARAQNRRIELKLTER